MKDRRRCPRATPGREVAINVAGSRAARVLDVSTTGAHFELDAALNPNKVCRLAVTLPDGIVQVAARVVHCKLVGFDSPGGQSRPVYRAGVEFIDLDAKLATSIYLAFDAQFEKPVRTGPIKVRVDVDAIEEAAEFAKQPVN